MIVFALAGLPDGFHGLFSTLELQLGLFVGENRYMSKTTTELEQELYEAKLETRRLRAEMSMALRFTKDDEMDAEATRRAISKFLKIEY